MIMGGKILKFIYFWGLLKNMEVSKGAAYILRKLYVDELARTMSTLDGDTKHSSGMQMVFTVLLPFLSHYIKTL